jgi:hypothetical protein
MRHTTTPASSNIIVTVNLNHVGTDDDAVLMTKSIIDAQTHTPAKINDPKRVCHMDNYRSKAVWRLTINLTFSRFL